MDASAKARSETGTAARKRSLWFQLHLWIGWIAAAPIAIVCLTGALLVFEHSLFEWEYPELHQLKVSGEPLSVQQVLERYRSANPPLQVNHLGIPASPQHAYSAYCTEIRPEGNRGTRAFLNPYTGEVIRQSDRFSISETLIALHRRLAGGKIGQQIVAVSSLALAVTAAIGVILWWPLRKGTFKRAWRRGRALDWHNSIGLVALIPLIVMAITGITFTWGQRAWPLLDKLQGRPSQVSSPKVTITPGEEKISMDRVVDWVRTEFPDKRITGIQPGNSARSPIKLFLDADGSNLRLIAHPYTGEELQRIENPWVGPVGWYRENVGKLHTLGPYGIAVRILWGLCSLGGTALVATGLWISIKRWRRRKRSDPARE